MQPTFLCTHCYGTINFINISILLHACLLSSFQLILTYFHMAYILLVMQFFCCYTSRSEDLLNLLAGTKLIFSKDKNIVLGMIIINIVAWSCMSMLCMHNTRSNYSIQYTSCIQWIHVPSYILVYINLYKLQVAVMGSMTLYSFTTIFTPTNSTASEGYSGVQKKSENQNLPSLFCGKGIL